MVEVDFDKPEYKRLLRNLYAFSRGLFNQLYNTEVNNKGKSFGDYVHDALEKHMRGKDNYNPSRGTLDYHLKYNVIRQLIINDLPLNVRKAYKESTQKGFGEKLEMLQRTEEPDQNIDPDDLTSTSFGLETIDKDLIFKEIEIQINGDHVVEQIYLAVMLDKYKLSDRSEISTDFNISLTEFDNGKRRFLTILKRVFKNIISLSNEPKQ